MRCCPRKAITDVAGGLILLVPVLCLHSSKRSWIDDAITAGAGAASDAQGAVGGAVQRLGNGASTAAQAAATAGVVQAMAAGYSVGAAIAAGHAAGLANERGFESGASKAAAHAASAAFNVAPTNVDPHTYAVNQGMDMATIAENAAQEALRRARRRSFTPAGQNAARRTAAEAIAMGLPTDAAARAADAAAGLFDNGMSEEDAVRMATLAANVKDAITSGAMSALGSPYASTGDADVSDSLLGNVYGRWLARA